MIRRCPARSRPGAFAIEGAIVYSALFMIMLAMIDGGMGVFRYLQVACQAREAARWASVRGSGWASETGQSSPTESTIKSQVVAPLEIGMDALKVNVQVQWINEISGAVGTWDSSGKAPTSLTTAGHVVTNHVRVTVTYQWQPGFFPLGPFTLRSVSEMPMSF